MRQILNIGSEAIQRHTIIFDEFEIVLLLRFFPKTQHWAFDVEYKGRNIYGEKLSVGVPHIVSANLPFDFWVTDNSGNGIDPFQIDDFSNGRCSLYLLEPAEMVTIRNGAEVPL